MRGLDQFLQRHRHPPPRFPAVAETTGVAAAVPQLLIHPASVRTSLDFLDGAGKEPIETRYKVRDPIAEPIAAAGGVDAAALAAAVGALWSGATFSLALQDPDNTGSWSTADIVGTTDLPPGFSLAPFSSDPTGPDRFLVPDRPVLLALMAVSAGASLRAVTSNWTVGSWGALQGGQIEAIGPPYTIRFETGQTGVHRALFLTISEEL